MRKELEDRIKLIDNSLDCYVPMLSNPQSKIYEAMRYSLFAGGKRLRPILMLEVAKIFDSDWNDVKEFACALEMIHTYSLIHDDLPAMDNDNLRRGMPTNHIKFDEATAILAGDALLNKAFEVVASQSHINSGLFMRALQFMSNASGTEGMIGGQVVDIDSEGKEISIDTLKYIHSLKTGALIRTACVVGAILSGASDDDINLIDEYAVNTGIAFQIRDDILDITGNTSDLGKPVGSDAELNKCTYFSILGIEKSEELVREYSDKAKNTILKFGDKADFLVRLTDYLITRNN